MPPQEVAAGSMAVTAEPGRTVIRASTGARTPSLEPPPARSGDYADDDPECRAQSTYQRAVRMCPLSGTTVEGVVGLDYFRSVRMGLWPANGDEVRWIRIGITRHSSSSATEGSLEHLLSSLPSFGKSHAWLSLTRFRTPGAYTKGCFARLPIIRCVRT